jgi:tRNA (guanine37-N1)-methyltransferase
MFENIMSAGVIGRAADRGVIAVDLRDIRSYSEDNHRRTDDEPFGGGAGMVMTVQPIAATMDAIGAARARADGERYLYMSPRGRLLCHDLALELSREDRLVLLCGRYEGVDERVLDAFGFE